MNRRNSPAEQRDPPTGRLVLVEYYLTGDQALIFFVTAEDTEPALVSLPVDTGELAALVVRFALALDRVTEGPALLEQASAILDHPVLVSLVAPVLDRVRPGDRLCLVPHGPLHRVPLHAVPCRGVRLADAHPVVYTPSAAVLRYCQANRRGARSTALVVADPPGTEPLTFGLVHAAALTGRFDADRMQGAEASRAALLRRLGGPAPDAGTAAAHRPPPGILHIGAHGVFDPEDPMASGVELADGRLTATDMLGLRLTGTLVVLAACRTGVSDTRPGDELLGLIRALLHAGAPAVLVSLWKVDELSTAMLLDEFYRSLGDGSPAVVALHRAQSWLRRRTAADVLAYVGQARDSAGTSHPAAARLALAEARIRLVAQDFVGAAGTAQAALTLAGTARDRRRVEGVLYRARFLAGTGKGVPVDLDRRLYDSFFFWAPFVLVGDWD
ncbi:CHAT domain-containing protein [Micromonospora sp. WMMD714]|uniref:CHAT domain-containing protein n=1 Tax=Micromonospora sp. WMMD714 TaxID=3016097 RepID=UPI00249A8E50|nr:CHAT domain-containing protein [Micromonospora sp. WMMD714]WFE65130.1 CHAT domain-containing protein [Micromonospora sp. WMMD714]